MNYQKILCSLLFIAVVAVACAFRFPALDSRPMHGDEANQAYRLKLLLEEGRYEYDPHEHHGPTLYYFMLPILKIAGVEMFQEMTETQLRLLPALFGMATVLLVVPLRRALGAWPALWAALFTAVSHAMVFYSRYFIQESLLVFFIVAALYCGWRYFETRTMRWAILAGLCLGLLHATKETCVIAYAAMVGGVAIAWLAQKCMGDRVEGGPSLSLHPFRWYHPLAALGSAAAVSIILFSAFFTHWRGPLDSVLTFATYLGRAEGTGSTALHDQPWYFYLQRLIYWTGGTRPIWSEGLVMALSVVGCVAVLVAKSATGDKRFQRFLAAFALLMTFAYCAIPYKTPWNLLAFYQPLILLAGIGAAWIVRLPRSIPVRAVVVLALLAGTAQLAQQTRRGITIFSADPRNPCVYAHPVRRLVEQAAQLHEIASHHPDGTSMHINVIRENADYWPLPWYLRDFDTVGYWTQIPETLDAPVIITGRETGLDLEPRLRETHKDFTWAFRPGEILTVFVQNELWDAYMESQR